MSKFVPIPRTVEDPSYRYKMPLLETRFEGRGIGIKTNLLNLFGIAKALEIELKYIVKFLSIDIGTDTKIKSETQHSVTFKLGLVLAENCGLSLCLDPIPELISRRKW